MDDYWILKKETSLLHVNCVPLEMYEDVQISINVYLHTCKYIFFTILLEFSAQKLTLVTIVYLNLWDSR